MDQKVIELYDEYTHRPLDRRVFMERLIALTGSTVAATAALATLEPNYALGAIVADNDQRVDATTIDDSASGLKCYVASPRGVKADGADNLVIVIHENRGLNPHIQDIARRLAVDGFVALAPDMLTPLGGTPDDADKARDMFGRIDIPAAVGALGRMVEDRKRKNPKIKIGMVGFCWGGGVVNAAATAIPRLDAAVVFYGVSPKAENAARIKARMMMHYAGLDKRINDTVPDFEKALKAAGVKYEAFVYDGVNHAFNNDTAGDRYNEAAAKLAWSRTIDFFRATLK